MKYSETVVRRILDGLRRGLPQKLAAQRAGVSEDTVCRWKGTHPEFRVQVEQAQIAFIRRNVGIIQTAATEKNKWGQSQWQAAAWLLERRYPEFFAQRPPETTPANISIRIIAPDEARKKLTVTPAAKAMTPGQEQKPQPTLPVVRVEGAISRGESIEVN